MTRSISGSVIVALILRLLDVLIYHLLSHAEDEPRQDPLVPLTRTEVNKRAFQVSAPLSGTIDVVWNSLPSSTK